MNTTTTTLGALVDQALAGLQASSELGRRILLGTTIDADDTAYTVSDATLVNVTDRIEFGVEQHFVTVKSDDTASATLTVIRGYDGTTAAAHTSGDVGAVNPPWTRKRVADQIVAAFPYMEGNRLPLIVTSADLTPEADPLDTYVWLIDIPAAARGVYLVRAGLRDVNGWEFIDNLPTTGTYAYTTGSVVRLPPWSEAYNPEVTPENLVFTVVYKAAYTWSADPPVEASTIEIAEGTAEVPVRYAVWRLVEAREVSRHQIDRSEEYMQGLRETGPQLVRLVRESFFSCLDVARRLEPAPRSRPFVSYPTFSEVY
jgi:hypothetical protein